MKYKVYISQVWTFTTEIDAPNKETAEEIAGDIAVEIDPMKGIMTFGQEYVEVEEVKGERL